MGRKSPSFKQRQARRRELGIAPADRVRQDLPEDFMRGPLDNPHGLAPSGLNRAARRRR